MRTVGIFFCFLLLIVLAWVAFSARHTYMPQLYAPAATTTAPVGTSSTSTAINMTDSIEIAAPASNGLIHSPLYSTGRAKGAWFFEGTFPVELVDAKGTLIAKSQAHAIGEWTTLEFVPFSLDMSFIMPTTTATGLLIFKNDNSSGDPSKDVMFAIPVRFK